jgi:hypothetical protein
MATDIKAIYALDSRAHRQYVDRSLRKEKWDSDKLSLLGGLFIFCTDRDMNAAISLYKSIRGIADKDKYHSAKVLVNALKRYHPFFSEYLQTGAAATGRREEFEKLLGAYGLTIEGIRAEYDKRNNKRIRWSSEENMLLWTGLVRYCGLSYWEATYFLQKWFNKQLVRRDSAEPFKYVLKAIHRSGRKVEDIAPVRDGEAKKKKMEELNAILARETNEGESWTIEKVKEAKNAGRFSNA